MDEQVTIEMETTPQIPVKTPDDPSFNPNSDPHEHQYGININKQIVCMLCGREKPPLEPITPVSPTSQIAAQTEVIPETASQTTDQQPEPINEEQTPSIEQEGAVEVETTNMPPLEQIAKDTADKIIRDEKGRILKGIAQDTNKNGTAGRPCNYCALPEHYQHIIDEYLKEYWETDKPKIPYIEELALRMEIDDATFVIWAKKLNKNGEGKEIVDSYEHPELYNAYTILKTLQKFRLKQRALGRYNPHGALYLLNSDHGVMQTNKNVVSGDKNEPLQITIVEDKKFEEQ